MTSSSSGPPPSRSGMERTAMPDASFSDGRQHHDRRRRPTTPWDALRPGGRRGRPRRIEERLGPFFVDRFHPVMLAMIVALLCLTLLDGVLTLELIELNSEEANPIMAQLISRGALTFLMGKYLMTAAGLPFLVVYQHYPLFRTRFRVGWLLPIFIGLYCVLLLHQWSLFRIGRPESALERRPVESRREAGHRARSPHPRSAAARLPLDWSPARVQT